MPSRMASRNSRTQSTSKSANAGSEDFNSARRSKTDPVPPGHEELQYDRWRITRDNGCRPPRRRRQDPAGERRTSCDRTAFFVRPTKRFTAERALALTEFLDAVDDLKGHQARYDRIMGMLRKIVGAGNLTVQSGNDPSLIDMATDPYPLRVPSHGEVVEVVASLARAQKRVADARGAVSRAGVNLQDLA